ncbi:MAG TPA: hypothetical protein VFL62_15575 [Bradyrhizobium sp.]|uniref:hypothetical protein n=1 Tax=Bradyrhizobium sp. TaxID=376 RepID=UPI002D808565|nr:hypothetical protein [Bradyrhizobium sp.]HET7887643.1 hypothetical protein [Bradyrhizobium sp.]
MPVGLAGLDRLAKALNHWCFQAQAPKMLEIGIISIIVLAVGYWVTLWLMGRHDDVLHGDFVHAEDGVELPALADQPLPLRPPFPPKPPFPAKPAATRSPVPKPSVAKPAPPAAPAPTLSDRSDTLRTLLASIKRDLKDASKL